MAVSATGSSTIVVLWLILGGGIVALGVVALFTWAGSARAAYIRRYDKIRGVHLPAGYLEEWIADIEARQTGNDFFDPILRNRRQRARHERIWTAMKEPQDDPDLETLRMQALRRSTVAAWFGVAAYVLVGFMFLWSIFH